MCAFYFGTFLFRLTSHFLKSSSKWPRPKCVTWTPRSNVTFLFVCLFVLFSFVFLFVFLFCFFFVLFVFLLAWWRNQQNTHWKYHKSKTFDSEVRTFRPGYLAIYGIAWFWQMDIWNETKYNKQTLYSVFYIIIEITTTDEFLFYCCILNCYTTCSSGRCI